MKKILSISFTFALVLAFAIPQASFAMSTFESSTQTEVRATSISTLQSQIAALTAQLESLKAMLSKQRDSVRPNTNDVYNQAKPLTQPITSHGCAPGEKFDTRTGERCSDATNDSTGIPSIKVLNPNGGESYKINSSGPIVFSYAYNNIQIPDTFNAYVSNVVTGVVSGVEYHSPATEKNGKDQGVMNINGNVKDGEYKVGVCMTNTMNPAVPFKPLCDWSDAAFKVTTFVTPTVNADVTGNGIVNIDDLLAVISHWGACPIIDPTIAPVARYAACTSDIDHDGMVGQSDMKLVQDNWTH